MASQSRRADGEVFKSSGYKSAASRPDVKKFRADNLPKVPPKVDLREHMTDIEDQRQVGSCTANAVVGAYEYLAKRHHSDESWDVSRLFVYYNARYLAEEDPIEDSGSAIFHAIDSLRQYGACSEETWPYDEDQVNEEPPPEAYEEAAQFLVEDVQSVPVELKAWKEALAEGYPIIFAVRTYDSFQAHRRPGLIPMPGKKDQQAEEHGLHAMLCVGYSDPDQVFIVRNSWGEGWGDGGYCYMPYRYVISEEHNLNDSWLIRQVEPLIFDDGTWGDDEPLLPTMDTVLAEMSDEDYGALVEELGEVQLENRLAFLIWAVLSQDGEISEPEQEAATETLSGILEALGSRLSAKKVWRRTEQLIEDLDEEAIGALFEETVTIFGRYFDREALAGFTEQIAEIASADDASDEELGLLNDLITAWQLEDFGTYDVEGEEEDSEDEEDEDSEGEEDEDSEDEEDEDSEDEEESSDEYWSETRLAHLLLMIAGEDGEWSKRERKNIARIVEAASSELFEGDITAEDAIDEAMALLEEGEDDGSALLEETVELFAGYYEAEALAGLIDQCIELAQGAEVSGETMKMLRGIKRRWRG